MPMIDVYAPNDLLPNGSDRRIGEELTLAVLRAEGVKLADAIPSRKYGSVHPPNGSHRCSNGGQRQRADDPSADHHAAWGVDAQRSKAAREGGQLDSGRDLRRSITGPANV